VARQVSLQILRTTSVPSDPSLAVFDDHTRSNSDSSEYGQSPGQAIRAVQDLSHRSADSQNPASKARRAISPIEEPDLSTTNAHSGADSVVIKQEPHSAWGETTSAKRRRKQIKATISKVTRVKLSTAASRSRRYNVRQVSNEPFWDRAGKHVWSTEVKGCSALAGFLRCSSYKIWKALKGKEDKRVTIEGGWQIRELSKTNASV
jgi:hypothetical protein